MGIYYNLFSTSVHVQNSHHKELKKWLIFPVSYSVYKSPDHSHILLLLFSHSVLSDPLRSHGLQHTRPSCPSPSPGDCSNSCPSSRWCHPTILSSVIFFSSCLQSFSASGAFSNIYWLHLGLFTYIHIYVYVICICICVYIHIHMHTHIYIYIRIYIYRLYIYTHIYYTGVFSHLFPSIRIFSHIY